MNVYEIIDKALRESSYDGLTATDFECGCQLGDLMPCDGPVGSCVPGYLHCDPRPGHKGEWIVSTRMTMTMQDWVDREDEC